MLGFLIKDHISTRVDLHAELPKLQKTRQQFTQQQHENEMVLKVAIAFAWLVYR